MLSHSLAKQADDLIAAEFDTFDQAYYHPHVRQHWRVLKTRLVQHHPVHSQFDFPLQCVCRWFAGQCLLRIEIRRRLAIGETYTALAAAIETFLIAFSVCRLIVRGTTLAGTLQVMMVAAAEWTTQVPPICVPGMSEKPNPTAQAGNGATLKLGVGLQNRVQGGLILQDKRLGAIVLMPIRPNREKLLDAYGKKAKLSVIILTFFTTSSSYHLGAKATRGRARFFYARWTRKHTNRPHKPFAPYRSANPSRLPDQRSFAARQILSRLLGKKKALFFLPSSGQFT